jgi:hypothetical protein
MHFNWTITGDGIATFLTAVVALVAAWIAYRGVKKQIAAEKEAHEHEVERQKKAVATAILFEIDDFYRYHLRGARVYFEELARRKELFEVIRMSPTLFAVYQGNTPRLGELPSAVVEVVLYFHSKAEQFFALREDYRAERDGRSDSADHVDSRKATTLFGHLKNSLPGLTGAAYNACERLCDFTGVEFKVPRIAIAGEDIEALTRETEQIEHQVVHRI